MKGVRGDSMSPYSMSPYVRRLYTPINLFFSMQGVRGDSMSPYVRRLIARLIVPLFDQLLPYVV